MRKSFPVRRAVAGAGWFMRQMRAASIESTEAGRVHRCRECGGLIKLGAVCRVCHVELRKDEVI